MERAPSLDRETFDAELLSRSAFGPSCASVTGASPVPSAPLEIELRFFVSLERIKECGALQGIEPLRIRQDYFPERRIPSLLESYRVYERFDVGDEITSARLRRTERSGNVQYSIELKGSKRPSEEGKISRVEISIPIEKSEYKRLSTKATAGSLEKLRYEIEGMLLCPTEGPVAVTAQIDMLERAGKSRQKVKTDYVTVDVEIPSLSAAGPLRRGLHSFDFLRDGAVDLSTSDDALSDAMSTRRLAREGITRRAKKAIRKLHDLSGH